MVYKNCVYVFISILYKNFKIDIKYCSVWLNSHDGYRDTIVYSVETAYIEHLQES